MDDYTLDDIDEAQHVIYYNIIEDGCITIKEETVLYRVLLMLSDLKRLKEGK